MRRSQTVRKGFTLVEILIVVIILGILAAIVIPQFTNASTAARQSNLTSQLQTLRSQIQLYKLNHNDKPPLLVSGLGWDLMIKCTSPAGAVSTATPPTVPDATFSAGPYMPSPVTNPLTNSSTLVAPGQAAATAGWVYDEATGDIHGINAAGAQSDDGN